MSSTVTIYQKDLCRQAHRMDRLMRCLPIPTGGKPSEWSVFGRKNLFSLPTGYERPFWPKIFEEKFCPSTGSLGREAKLTVSENFLSPIPTGGFCLFWTKDLQFFFPSVPTGQKSPFGQKNRKLFSPNIHWREMGCLAKKIWNFFSPVPTGQFRLFWTK